MSCVLESVVPLVLFETVTGPGHPQHAMAWHDFF